jgi:hypothetical protein
VSNPLDIKENDKHALDFPLGELLLCLGHNRKPPLITSDNVGQEGYIIRGNLMKLLADIDETLLLLNSCQKSHPSQIHYSK